MSDWLKKLELWMKLVERDLDGNPNGYIFDRLRILEERVIALESRIDHASKTAL
jgi:hypothetical protein